MKKWYKNEEVEVISEPDSRGKVAVKRTDGRLSLLPARELEESIKDRVTAWWNQDTFTIRKVEKNQTVTLINLHKSILPMLRRAMFSKKASIRSSMEPTNKSVMEPLDLHTPPEDQASMSEATSTLDPRH